MDLLKQLNDKQNEAVRETEGYVRVIAGAGSGKTKLLVSRYAYLVRDYGIDSANILCVTFTNKAAAEMKKRIRALIGAEYDTALICTYHGFCARMLRENPEKLFLSKGFQIIDASQQKAMLEEIYQKYELKLDYASFEHILARIGVVKRNTEYVSAMIDPAERRILPTIATTEDRIVEDFLQRQKAIYALDFHDLINYALYLLETNAEVREKWQDRLNYIMVDEFQDSSAREMRLIDILCGRYQNLMIVGDPDQNIYEWRGSDVRLLVDFDRTHPGTQTIFLNRNYRSTPQILRCANVLIDKNELRLKKELYTQTPDGAAVYHVHAKSDEAETAYIADTVKSLCKENGYTYSDFAVLYRSGFLSRVVEKKLVEQNIPYEIFGGVKFYQRMEVQDVIAYLRLIAQDDDMAFKRIVNTPRRKFGRGKMAALESLRETELSMFTQGEASLFSTLKQHMNDGMFRASGAAQFVAFIEEMRTAADGMRISELVRRVTAESGYEQYIRELGDEERLENLAEFKRIADEFERNFGEELTLTEFLQQLAIQSNEDEEKPREAVKLMTIHAAKGLEFPVVFVVGFTEGIFPSAKTIEERKKAGLEEERRLCYVAITRARERLYLTDSEGTSQNGIKKLPSRFLNEIGAENYIRIGKIDEELERESRGYIHRVNRQFEEETDRQVGDAVEHHAFGAGTVIGKDEKRGSYIIKFDKLAQPRHISKDYFAPKPAEEELSAPVSEAPREAEGEVSKEKFRADPPLPPTAMPTDIPTTEPPPPVREEARSTPLTASDRPKKKADPAPTDEAARTETFVLEGGKKTDPAGDALTEEQKTALRQKLAETDNLWKRDDVPHDGWRCVGITDLGSPCGVCEMCGEQIIRYVHHMEHDHYRPLGVGCVCAGKMEGDIGAAKKREREFRNRQSRRESFGRKQWKVSRNGNPYLKIKEHIVVLCKLKNNRWKYSFDNTFCAESYPSREAVIDAVFDILEKERNT